MFGAVAARLDGLRARYAAPERAYHGQLHIDLLLGLLGEVRPFLVSPDGVELAVWYHDAVYVPLSAENEISSAALLQAELAGLADPGLIDRATVLVLATRAHAVPAGIAPDVAADCAWFLDMDLSILGADAETFAWYDAAIRREYTEVTDAEWRVRRPRVLGTFLARERLYLTDYFHTRLDAQARANLRRAIAA
jgi:predicted metal-dependent HD superfamily phosphohydrolase